jgi:hypothetical protein
MAGDVRIDSVERFHQKYKSMQKKIHKTVEQATNTDMGI